VPLSAPSSDYLASHAVAQAAAGAQWQKIGVQNGAAYQHHSNMKANGPSAGVKKPDGQAMKRVEDQTF
jgi:hypothetical protein